MRLGSNQMGVLRGLRDHGGWPGGWVWGTPSETKSVLASLVKCGLVKIDGEKTRHGFPVEVYRLTEAGREAAGPKPAWMA